MLAILYIHVLLLMNTVSLRGCPWKGSFREPKDEYQWFGGLAVESPSVSQPHGYRGWSIIKRTDRMLSCLSDRFC